MVEVGHVLGQYAGVVTMLGGVERPSRVGIFGGFAFILGFGANSDEGGECARFGVVVAAGAWVGGGGDDGLGLGDLGWAGCFGVVPNVGEG